jgi:cyclophilin family peptidyl-prolyl cis-trans isomerase
MQPRQCAHRIAATVITLGVSLPVWSTEVAVCTDLGPFTIELLDEEAPEQVATFLGYVEQGFYSGTVFHRVVADVVVQGGVFDRRLHIRETSVPVPVALRNGLSTARGTLASYWRVGAGDPTSTASHFYIFLREDSLEDFGEDWGYTVFGRVTSGIETLDTVSNLPDGAGLPAADLPEPLVAITSMAVLDRAALDAIPAEARIETIKLEIAHAYEVGDTAGVLEWVRLYRASCSPVDPDVLIVEAEAALSTNSAERARYVLDDYFSITDASHPGYGRAMSLAETTAFATPPSVSPDAVFAHCELPAEPPLPNGDTASRTAMADSRAALQAFIDAGDVYLDCLDEVLKGDAITDEQRALGVEKYNQTIARTEQLGKDFNEQVRIFRDRAE